jgi:hypothetical protein
MVAVLVKMIVSFVLPVRTILASYRSLVMSTPSTASEAYWSINTVPVLVPAYRVRYLEHQQLAQPTASRYLNSYKLNAGKHINNVLDLCFGFRF